MTSTVRITGRRGSHFTRVTTMFAVELGVPFSLESVRDLRSLDPAAYGGHPGLKIPTLHVGEVALFGTENICRKLTELAGRANDPRVVLAEHVSVDLARSAQELVWFAMSAQVQLVVGVVFGGLARDALPFAKASAGMRGALGWLDANLHHVLSLLPARRDVSVFEVSLFCLFEHLKFRPTIEAELYPALTAFAATFSARDSARATTFSLEAAPTTRA